jgi:hypothetical protein
MNIQYPFDTCEKPQNIIAQPYSVIFNIINTIIIFYYLLKTQTNHSKILMFSIFLFQCVHIFSHTKHIPGTIQINITHFLSYFMNIAFLYVFYKYTLVIPANILLLCIFLFIILDIYAIYNLPVSYLILTQSLIFISSLYYYHKLLPDTLQNNIKYIIIVICIIIGLFINEKMNCQKMLNKYPNFPFHIFIEIFGILLFYILCSNFYSL